MAKLVKKVQPVEDEEVSTETLPEAPQMESEPVFKTVVNQGILCGGGLIPSPRYEVKADRGTFTGLDTSEVRYFIESVLRHSSKITITKLEA